MCEIKKRDVVKFGIKQIVYIVIFLGIMSVVFDLIIRSM
jgi:hypothetical protein